ncbi:hypothetical protein MCC93_09300 [Morococcus cerebrosus]|uniref:Uncharacterized protein n=1 Tax=Morococcus cerebrosus TaxID=1056807 RepID=A0A0C1GS29_9NEIS|nr:hypothetical protein MCC93_09300 [Morococcus cerebrosus]
MPQHRKNPFIADKPDHEKTQAGGGMSNFWGAVQTAICGFQTTFCVAKFKARLNLIRIRFNDRR